MYRFFLSLFASLFLCTALLRAQAFQFPQSKDFQPIAVIIASSNLRWTVPTVVSSLRPEVLLEIAERLPASGSLHTLQRATESRNLRRVDPYVQLPPSELKAFCNEEVLRHLNLATMRQAQPPKPDSVAVVVLIDSKENVYYKHLSSDQLMMLQNSWLEIARTEQTEPSATINAMKAALALSRTIQSIAELNRERGFYLGY